MRCLGKLVRCGDVVGRETHEARRAAALVDGRVLRCRKRYRAASAGEVRLIVVGGLILLVHCDNGRDLLRVDAVAKARQLGAWVMRRLRYACLLEDLSLWLFGLQVVWSMLMLLLERLGSLWASGRRCLSVGVLLLRLLTLILLRLLLILLLLLLLLLLIVSVWGLRSCASLPLVFIVIRSSGSLALGWPAHVVSPLLLRLTKMRNGLK